MRLFISYWYNKVIALLTERATCVSSKGFKTDRAALHGLKDMAAWYAKPKPPFEPIPRPKTLKNPHHK